MLAAACHEDDGGSTLSLCHAVERQASCVCDQEWDKLLIVGLI